MVMPATSRRTLDFVVIGAQKAASTWIVQALAAHPDIWLPVHELPCFEKEYPESNPLEPFEHFRSERVTRGVKNNNLMIREESPHLLFRHSPAMKIIVSLRDPVDRLISAYYWQMWVGTLPVLPAERGIADALDRRDERLFLPGFYARHIGRYLDIFGSAQVLPLLFDDIRDTPRETIRRSFEFLGVEPGARPALPDRQPKASVYSLPRIRWNGLRHRFILQRDEGPSGRTLWKPRLSTLERGINALVVGVDRLCLSPILTNRKPSLPKDIIRRIADVYMEDCEELQRLIGRDLSRWTTMKEGRG